MERLLRIFLAVAMYVAEISAVSADPILTLTDGSEAAYSDLLSSLHTQCNCQFHPILHYGAYSVFCGKTRKLIKVLSFPNSE